MRFKIENPYRLFIGLSGTAILALVGWQLAVAFAVGVTVGSFSMKLTTDA